MRTPRVTILAALAALCLIAHAAPATGQTPVVINPTIIEWDPSADHGTVLSDGTPIVTRYEVRIYMRGARRSPFQVHDAGTPTPGANGKIAVANAGWLTLSAMNAEGFARVAAIGPAGEGVSEPSNPVARVGPPAVPPPPVVSRR